MLRDLVGGSQNCESLFESGYSNPIQDLFSRLFQTAEKTGETREKLNFQQDGSVQLSSSQYIGNLFDKDPANFSNQKNLHSASDVRNREENIIRNSSSNRVGVSGSDTRSFLRFFNWRASPKEKFLKVEDRQYQEIIDRALKTFVEHAKNGLPFNGEKLPYFNINIMHQQEFRNRVTVLSRHLYSNMGFQYADQQVERLLESLNVRNTVADPLLSSPINYTAVVYQNNPFLTKNLNYNDSRDGIKKILTHHGVSQELEDLLNFDQNENLSNSAIVNNADFIFNQTDVPFEKDTSKMASYYNFHSPMPSAYADIYSRHQSMLALVDNYFGSNTASAAPQQQRYFLRDSQVPFVQSNSLNGSCGSGEELRESEEELKMAGQNLFEKMMQDPDPKFQDSKFLQFVKKISEGKITIKNEQLVEVEEAEINDMSNFKNGDSKFNEDILFNSYSNNISDKEIVDDSEQQLSTDPYEYTFEDIISHNEISRDLMAEFGNLEESWININDREEIDYQFLQPSSNYHETPYSLSPINPFKGDPDALSKAALFFQQGDYMNTILAAEAATEDRKGSAEAWKLLGLSLSECDEDLKAIVAFKKGIEVDKTDISLLVPLAAAQANEILEEDAMSTLMNWMRQHPVHSKVLMSNPRPPGNTHNVSQQLVYMVEIFTKAMQNFQDDPDLFIATGILNHMQHQYDNALTCFKAASQISPTDHTIHNKIGATLANSGRYASALEFYQKAISAKAGYVRGLINHGISLESNGDYHQAMESYILALKNYPDNINTWYRVSTLATILQREDLKQHIESKNIQSLFDQYSTSKQGNSLN